MKEEHQEENTNIQKIQQVYAEDLEEHITNARNAHKSHILHDIEGKKTTKDVQSRVQEYATLLHDKKGRDISIINLQEHYKAFDAVIIVTANSTRHAQSLATGILDYSGEHGYEYLRMEGYNTGTWILVDLNDIIVHIFKEEERALYAIEGVWEVPVVSFP